ncbi:brachyurin-like [Malaya genurostris]|uniref:brachyurin-like n=1 Tax=Malaya genurostris TaxID=325434 RepID=UPI0026F3ED4A|nr:brachyurin-like [Malaya genurostris]
MKTIALLIGGLAFALAFVDLSKAERTKKFDWFWPQHRGSKPLPDSRVINGQEARPGQFPYQALVLSFFEDDESALCGGTLLTQNYVLTAAHCVIIDSLVTHGTVTLGVHNRQVEEETQQRIDFASINVHQNFSESLLINDVATIQLATPAVFNDFVQPIDLPSVSDTRRFSGFTGTISGFGRTSPETGSLASDVIMYTSNPIMTNSGCQSSISTIQIQAQYICQSAAGGRSACHGDSGGPLTIRENGRSLQVGIASFVRGGDCGAGVPVVFARVPYFLAWIRENSDVVLRD